MNEGDDRIPLDDDGVERRFASWLAQLEGYFLAAKKEDGAVAVAELAKMFLHERRDLQLAAEREDVLQKTITAQRIRIGTLEKYQRDVMNVAVPSGYAIIDEELLRGLERRVDAALGKPESSKRSDTPPSLQVIKGGAER